MDSAIAKIQSEKKSYQEAHQQALDDLQSEEDKVAGLVKMKNKTDQQLDEFDSALETEKKIRMDLERIKRKLEGEARLAAEHVLDLEAEKTRLEDKMKKSELGQGQLSGCVEEKNALIAQTSKKMKEVQIHNDELQEELDTERLFRAKAEKQRTDLGRELEEMSERLDDSGQQVAGQIELNKRREAEMVKIRRDMEESNLTHESILVNMRKKNAEQVIELIKLIFSGT